VSVEAVDEPWRSGVTREVNFCVYIHICFVCINMASSSVCLYVCVDATDGERG
jgi:hypothetical protein